MQPMQYLKKNIFLRSENNIAIMQNILFDVLLKITSEFRIINSKDREKAIKLLLCEALVYRFSLLWWLPYAILPKGS
jgi:hypothetical protein